MENYINNFLFTYLPHIAFAVFWFGLITRIVYANRTIQARSTQLLARNGIRSGSNLFHAGIIAVFSWVISHFLFPKRSIIWSCQPKQNAW
jgi:nitrate reductase gamma subunit